MGKEVPATQDNGETCIDCSKTFLWPVKCYSIEMFSDNLGLNSQFLRLTWKILIWIFLI